MSTLHSPARGPASPNDSSSPWSCGVSLRSPPTQHSSARQTTPPGANLKSARRRYRVLLADDDRSIVETVSLILEASGYQPMAAEDGAQAWEMYLERGCDVLLTDLDMPRLSGFGLIERIRSHGDCVPVILSSGRIASEDIPAVLRQQIDAILPKPFGSDALLKTLRCCLHEMAL